MKRQCSFIILLLMCFPWEAVSQSVGIGSENFNADESAILELRSDTKGLLIPRLTSDQRNRINSPSTGLLVYQTDVSPGFYFYNGTEWLPILTTTNLPVADYQLLSFDNQSFRLTLDNGGTVDLSILRNGRSLEETINNGDGTITFLYNDGTSFTTNDLRGARGERGQAGRDAHTILTGTLAPTGNIGKKGDLYIDLTLTELYGPKKGSNDWGSPIPLKGPAGSNGTNGKTILSGNTPPDDQEGNNGDIYINTTTFDFFGPKTGGNWGTPVSLVGPQGANGANGSDGTDGVDGANGVDGTDGSDGVDGKSLLNGTTNPTPNQGNDGDFYINTASNQIFGPKTGGAWGTGLSLIGPAGADGTDGIDGSNGVDGTDGSDGVDGKSLLNGTTNPTPDQGNNGDFYINTASNQIFGPKTAGAWGTRFSLIGPAGADGTDGIDGSNGVDGTDGLDGTDGKSLLNGTTNPTPAQGNDGDFYINTASNQIFGPKTAGAWGTGFSLIGPAGADGTDGVDGTNGVDGTDGLDGTDGKSLLNGTTNPTPAQGNDGDFYINTASSLIFGPKTAGAWDTGLSLIGPAGADGTDGVDGTNGVDGADGQDGNTILYGTTNPSNAVGQNGDFYLNTNAQTIFGPKTGGSWPSGVSLTGVGIQSTSDNPDGSITFNFTDGSSFTSQPDGDFNSTNELISSLSLSGKTLQIVESGITRAVDLSAVSSSNIITDTDGNTTVSVDLNNANDDIIRFNIAGTQVMRLNNRTLELTNNLGTIAVGENAALNNSGAGNTIIGTEAGYQNSSGRFNVALGYRALRQNASGQGNVAIGYNAGFNETGSNKLYIDNTNTNTPLVWGDFANDIININGKLGVNIASPASMLNEFEVNGNALVNSLTETSDARLKKDVQPLTQNLQKLQQLRGVSFSWRTEEYPERRFRTGRQIGFLAQELKEVFPQLVSQSSSGFFAVSYSGLTPILVEAIKEQQTLIEDMAQVIEQLKKDLSATRKEIDLIKAKIK